MVDRTKASTTIELPNPIVQRPSDPFVIDGPRGWWLNLADIHIPFHDRLTVELAVKTAKEHDAKGVILNGDVLDFHQLSRWDKEPTAERYVVERELGLQFLAWLRSQLPKARIIFKEGNHEERLAFFLLRKAPELFELDVVQLPSLMHFERFGIEFVGDRRVIKFGKHLNVIHGHEYRPTLQASVSPARGLFLKAKANGVCAHFHRISDYHDSTINRHAIACWSIGCACDLRPYYSPLNSWSNGLAMMELCSDGDFVFRNLRVIEGKVY